MEKSITLEDIMTTRIISVDQNDSVQRIRAIFEKLNFHHLIILSENKLIGVISDRDLLHNLSPFLGTEQQQPRDIRILKKPVHELIKNKPVTTSKTTLVKDAAAMMLEKNISCLPIVSEDDKIEGIVTLRDIIKACLKFK